MRRPSVTVINPPNSPFTERSLLIEPIDVLTVATYVRSLGYDTRVFDMDATQTSPGEVERLLDVALPDVVVIPFDYHIPLFTSEAIPGVAEIVRRAAAFGSRVIVGGRPSNHYPARFLVVPGSVAVVGEMEPALGELLRLTEWSDAELEGVRGILFRSGEEIRRTPARRDVLDLATLPVPDRSLVDIGDYIDVRTMLTSRGCVEKCAFCPVHTFWGRWRRRPAEAVVDEIEHLVEQWNATKILFLDDHATVNGRRMSEISRLVQERSLRVALGCLGTVSCSDEAMLDSMYGAGFRWIHYGCEFADDDILTKLGKRINVAQIRDAIERTKRAGLRVRTSWILDSPGGDQRGLEATVDLIVESEPDEVRAHFLSLRAGAPIASGLVDEGELPSQYIHAHGPQTMLSRIPPDVMSDQVERLKESLAAKGYLVVENAADWRQFDAPATGDSAPRFISFCPGRYGVGWEARA